MHEIVKAFSRLINRLLFVHEVKGLFMTMGKPQKIRWNCLLNYRLKRYESFEEMLQAFLLESEEKLKALRQHAKKKLHIKSKRGLVK